MKNALSILAKYFSFSIVFYFLLLALLLFGYSAITIDIQGRLLLLASSFLFFSFIHFTFTCFLSACLSSLNKSVLTYFLWLSLFIIFIISLFIYTNIIGYFIGISNWGQAVDYRLLSDIVWHPFSFIGLLLIHDNATLILMAIILSVVILFAYYFLRRKDLLTIGDGFGRWNHLGFGFILFPIILTFATASISKDLLSSSVFRKDMFVSFVNPIDPLNDMINVSGMGDLDFSFEKVENFDKKNVIIISVECLRLDHLSFNGYHRKTTPFLESSYKAGNLIDMELSTATCANTFCGILTTLNSRNFQNLGHLKFGIHDYLKKQGYHINFLLSGLHESFVNLKKHYGNNIDTYIESKHYPEFDVNDDEFLFKALNDVKDYNGTPNFFFIHLMSPHIAGFKQDKFKEYKPTFDYKRLFKWQKRTINVDDDAVKLFTNNYDNSILQADDIIRRFLDQLKTKGFMDNAVVAIVGDHGESLGEHTGKFGHKHGLWQEYIGVPVMFIDPDTSFYKEKTYASQIDIAPTIIDRLQLPIPNHWEGKSLKEKNPNRVTYHETRNDKGYRVLASVEKTGTQINKFIYIPKTGEKFFYDLINDPLEQKNIITSCTNPSKFVDNLLNYKELTSSTENQDQKKTIMKEDKDKVIDFSKFLTKEMVRNNLNINSEIFKNYDSKSKKRSIASYFTWNEENGQTNTILIEVKTYGKPKKAVLNLQKNGIKVSPKNFKEVILAKIDNQKYYCSIDNLDILKFHKNKSIRISSTPKSQPIEKASLIQLINAIQKSL